jgi:hypothetical protein
MRHLTRKLSLVSYVLPLYRLDDNNFVALCRTSFSYRFVPPHVYDQYSDDVKWNLLRYSVEIAEYIPSLSEEMKLFVLTKNRALAHYIDNISLETLLALVKEHGSSVMTTSLKKYITADNLPQVLRACYDCVYAVDIKVPKTNDSFSLLAQLVELSKLSKVIRSTMLAHPDKITLDTNSHALLTNLLSEVDNLGRLIVDNRFIENRAESCEIC